MRNIKALLIAGSLLCGNTALAGAEQQQKQEQKSQEQQTQKQQKQQEAKKAFESRSVEGTVIKHKVVRLYESEKQKQEMAQKAQKQQEAEQSDKDPKNLVVLLKTKKGNDRLVVDLGSVETLPEVKDGETSIQAEGRLVKIGQKEFFVAKKAKIGDETYTLQHQELRAE